MKIVILDLNNIIFRAFFGIRQPLTTPDGTPSNALYGVFNMVHRIMEKIKPDVVIAALDSKSSLRKEEFKEYKNNRSKMPDPLKLQMPLIHQMLKEMGIVMTHHEGLEADDLIASIAKKYHDHEVYIASSDKDLMQLVNQNVKIYDSMKDVMYDELKVEEKFSLKPIEILDYLALLGDSSDNIPGVEGIGEKKAIALVKEFSTIEKLYENLDKVPEKLRIKLEQGKDSAFLSKKLASLREAHIDFILEPMKMDKEALLKSLTTWNMKSSIEKLNKLIV